MQGLKHLPEKAYGECDFLKKRKKTKKRKMWKHKNGIQQSRDERQSPRGGGGWEGRR